MATNSDALALLRKLQGRHPYPAGAILPPLIELEFQLRSAGKGRYASMSDLINWARKEPGHVDTLCRLLVIVAAIGNLNADDIQAFIVATKTTRVDRRRPVKPIKQPGDRLSPPMF